MNGDVSAHTAWNKERADAWKREQTDRYTDQEWARSADELALAKSVIDAIGRDNAATLVVRRWLDRRLHLPNEFSVDGQQYGSAKRFRMTLEEDLSGIVLQLITFKPVVGWDASSRKEKEAKVKRLATTAREFSQALADAGSPPMHSLLDYIPDQDGEKLLRGAFRRATRDVAFEYGLKDAPNTVKLDEEVYVKIISNWVTEVNSGPVFRERPKARRFTMASQIFDGDLFAEDEGRPLQLNRKFASYLAAFADDVEHIDTVSKRITKHGSGATLRMLAVELRDDFLGEYGDYDTGVIAVLIKIWCDVTGAACVAVTAKKVGSWLVNK